jgi:MFS family permease
VLRKSAAVPAALDGGLLAAFPVEERVRASVIFSVPTAVAPALGPVLGGYLLTYHDWGFSINVPVASTCAR